MLSFIYWKEKCKYLTKIKLLTGYTFPILLILTLLNQNILAQRDLETLGTDEDFKQFILANTPREDAFIALQLLAKKYIDEKNWSKAASTFDKYRGYFPEYHDIINKIIEMLNSPIQNIVPVNLSNNVNTSGGEYFPVITIDSKAIFFTGTDRGNGKDEDIFVTENINGIWQKPVILPKPFTTKDADAINSISADGNILVLFGNYKGAIGGGDNFYAEKIANGWSEIKPFPKPINTAYWECDGFFSADGKAFFFTSDRRGNIGDFHKSGSYFHGMYEGNTDIYVSNKTDSGWTRPVNLGKTINTPYTERSPFLHPDGKTLYFSSDGHYGLGLPDVFKSVRLSDTSWTEWSEPVNLGKDINTTGFDVAYKITTDGNYAYFASNKKGGYGGYDIYYVALPEEHRPERNVITVQGLVTNEKNEPIDAKILWSDLNTGRMMGELRSDPVTGNYIITLPVGNNYSYFADKVGYYSKSNNIDLTNSSEHDEMEVNIMLTSITDLKETGKPILINNIYFDVDKFDLKQKSFAELDRLYDFLNNNVNIVAEISAHTDDQGSNEYNLALSEKRAQSVVSYLINKGISAGRLIAKGYGETVPVSDNSTEEGRALNRRVEMKIVRID